MRRSIKAEGCSGAQPTHPANNDGSRFINRASATLKQYPVLRFLDPIDDSPP
ncbi:uncharacterized protein P884DRAFT_304684 [Thermothelomyces heterothallicus CBS 202.75]|uniref:uncharacterized protein n=1 Tax=Thermothelomyces heterothallicus CBS 202.75 TaxID=1149848 RepID=UPI003742E798